ncbi:unnamed protein product, partial [Polarella glacialis]
VLLVAPHAPAELSAAAAFVDDTDAVQAALAEHVENWHDLGSGVALQAAAALLRAPALWPILPRGLMDLNRGWQGRAEEQESLFGKGALDEWVASHLKEGAGPVLQDWYRASLAQIRTAAGEAGVRGFVEIHSYGDLGSTYDRRCGGRPVRRAEAAIVCATPWATAYPVGLARLLPGDLRGTPWSLQQQLGEALGRHGFELGPSPYPAQGPWCLSARFLAARWFEWLGRQGQLPAETAAHLAELAWTDEHDAAMEAAATGRAPELPPLLGVRSLASSMAEWSHEAGRLGDAFVRGSSCFTLVVEMRNDREAESGLFGQAVAEGLRKFLELPSVVGKSSGKG